MWLHKFRYKLVHPFFSLGLEPIPFTHTTHWVMSIRKNERLVSFWGFRHPTLFIWSSKRSPFDIFSEAFWEWRRRWRRRRRRRWRPELGSKECSSCRRNQMPKILSWSCVLVLQSFYQNILGQIWAKNLFEWISKCWDQSSHFDLILFCLFFLFLFPTYFCILYPSLSCF